METQKQQDRVAEIVSEAFAAMKKKVLEALKEEISRQNHGERI